jgi:hypothetical protein
MIQILKEITVWNTDFEMINHTYLLDGDKLIAYAVSGGDEIRLIKSELKIDKRGRKFIVSVHPGLKKLLSNQKKDPNERTFKINSKDKTYYVSLNKNKYKCTCTGFTYRGKCKHIDSVVAKIQQL